MCPFSDRSSKTITWPLSHHWTCPLLSVCIPYGFSVWWGACGCGCRVMYTWTKFLLWQVYTDIWHRAGMEGSRRTEDCLNVTYSLWTHRCIYRIQECSQAGLTLYTARPSFHPYRPRKGVMWEWELATVDASHMPPTMAFLCNVFRHKTSEQWACC